MNTEKISFTLTCVVLFLASTALAQLRPEIFLPLLAASFGLSLYLFLHVVRLVRTTPKKKVGLIYLN